MSINTYKNVLLVGAAGTVGKNILPDLLADSNFNVSILSRIDSTATFSSDVNVIKVDYSNQTALIKALIKQDVVISAVGGEAMVNNFDKNLIEAAIEAGVKWIIPSQFGSDLTNSFAASLPIKANKVVNVKLLKQKQSRIAHTFISTGPFLDSGFDNGFLGFDIGNRTVTIYDEGKYPCSGMRITNIGKIIVAVLHHPEISLNKRLYFADTTFTQLQALTLFEKYTNIKWTLNHVTTEESLKQGAKHLAEGNIFQGYAAYLMAVVYNEKGACNFEGKTSNKALGVEIVSLEQIIKEAVQRNNTAH
jgi:hypothetical protein